MIYLNKGVKIYLLLIMVEFSNIASKEFYEHNAGSGEDSKWG